MGILINNLDEVTKIIVIIFSVFLIITTLIIIYLKYTIYLDYKKQRKRRILMNLEKLQEIFELSDLDMRNLARYEEIRKKVTINMFEYLYIMKKYNANGDKKLAEFIEKYYDKYLEALKNDNTF